MEDPSHPEEDQPFFNISIFKNNVLLVSENHVSGDPGWTTGVANGPNSEQIYYSSGVFNLLGAFAATDSVTVQLTVADCGQSGHSGWAFLDGIGTVRPPDPGNGVPDGGSTALLLGSSLLGMIGIGRKLRQK